MDAGDSSDDEDIAAQQAAMASDKFGGIHKKMPLIEQDKKKFDSADYFNPNNNLKGVAANLEEEKKQ